MQAVKKMGSLSKMLGMLPGMGDMREAIDNLDDADIDRIAAIIQSMTPAERQDPKILNASRRARIAKGSGRTVTEVNQLVDRFGEAQKMMRQMNKGGGHARACPGCPGCQGWAAASVPRASRPANKAKPTKNKKGRSGNPAKRAAAGIRRSPEASDEPVVRAAQGVQGPARLRPLSLALGSAWQPGQWRAPRGAVWQNRAVRRGPLPPSDTLRVRPDPAPPRAAGGSPTTRATGDTTTVAVKIKLKRLGKIRQPQYRIVVADSRTKRDGRAIEEIGVYRPKEDPSFIQVDGERVAYWLGVGAQPTEAVEAILKVTGDWQTFKGLPAPEPMKVARSQARQACALRGRRQGGR